MGAPLKIRGKQTACAVLASGVVMSLTALTGGIAPAYAKPGDDPAVPTTTVAPQPPAAVPEAPAEKPAIADVPAPAAPAPIVAPTVEAPPAAAPAPAAPPVVAPPAEPTVEAPPPTRAPQPLAPTSAPTSAPAVAPTTGLAPAPVTSAARPPQRDAPAPSAQPPVTSVTKSPTTSTPVTESAAPSSPSAAATPSLAPAPPSDGPGKIESPASEPAASPSSQPAASPSTAPASSPAASSPESESTKSDSSSASSSNGSSAPDATPRLIAKVAPQTLDAPEADVQTALAAKPVEQKPVEAPKQEIADISRVIDLPNRDRDPFGRDDQNGRRDDDQVRLAGNWDRNVRQWRPDWVQYDEYYRPVLSNPYRDPVRIVYVYQNAPRVVWIPPLARIVLEVAQYAAYSFTAVVTNTINQAVNVAVGSFFGGGYFPGVGLPLPPPPPPLLNYANVPVQVRYPDATYQPFRVNKIVDVGPDRQYGEQKVLLDGVTPAWGQWTQTPSGERSFEVHKTQQFPGLDDPQPGPLPGDYQLTLASDESPSGINKRDVYLIAVAVACGALSIGAVVLAIFMGRRRRPLH